MNEEWWTRPRQYEIGTKKSERVVKQTTLWALHFWKCQLQNEVQVYALSPKIRPLSYAQLALHQRIFFLYLAFEINIVDDWSCIADYGRVKHLHLTLGYLSRETKKNVPKTFRSVIGFRTQPAVQTKITSLDGRGWGINLFSSEPKLTRLAIVLYGMSATQWNRTRHILLLIDR